MKDKENKSENMQKFSVEKQIEEMAKIIDDRLLEANAWIGSMNKGEGYWIAQELVKHYQPKPSKDSVVQPIVQSYSTHDNDLVVLSREELEEKYEPSENFMAVARELEELKESLEGGVVLSKEKYELLVECSSYEGVMKALKNEYAKGSKETAEKCYSIIDNETHAWIKHIAKMDIDISKRNIIISIASGLFESIKENIAKQFKVEIKE